MHIYRPFATNTLEKSQIVSISLFSNLTKVRKKKELHITDTRNRGSSRGRLRRLPGLWSGVDLSSGVLEVLKDFVGNGGSVLETKRI